MRRLLFLCGVLLTPMFVAGLAFGQAGTISIFADADGTNPYIYDDQAGLLSLYVVHTSAPGVMACQFSAPLPDCFTGSFVSDTAEFPVTIGNSQTFVAIGYGGCLTTPVHVLTINLLVSGTTPDCCEWEIPPYSSFANDYGQGIREPIAVVDCDGNLLIAQGGKAIINPNNCPCEQPVLSLNGYETVSWDDPLWTVQVEMVNSGPAEARNVSVTMHEDIPWLILPDAQCFYDNIPADATSWGDGDTYVFDLTDHPGGSFNAWFDVSYEDTCGETHTLRIDPEFDPQPITTADATTLADGSLGQNYPNPFNPITTIPVNLTEPMDVRLSIFDARGSLVRELANDHVQAGLKEYVWDGRDAQGNVVSSGMYFCRLATGASIETRKLVFLK